MDKIKLNKNTEYLHFEDNEVSELDADNKVLDSQKFETPAEARADFLEKIQFLEKAEEFRYEHVFYQPQFPPQRVKITKMGDTK